MAELAGELDVSNADDVAAAIRSRVANDTLGLVINLTRVQFIDSSGLAVLFQLGRRLQSRRQQLRVVVPPDAAIRPVVELVDLGNVATIDDSLDSALATLSSEHEFDA